LALIDKNNPVNEMDFKLNGFNEQEIYTGTMAYAHRIKNLLFMRPGDFPSIPEMGINIQGYRYKAMDELIAGALKENNSDQISQYIMDLPMENIDISTGFYNNDYVLILHIYLYQERAEIIYAIQQPRGNVINFNFKIYDSEKPVIH
jgi:hypothetical protein